MSRQFPYSSAPLRSVKEVQFGLLSPEEVRAISVAKIEYPETIDQSTKKPREAGLNDPRLGSIDRNFKCQTCGEDMAECPGHFGHIELTKPVFHIGFIAKIKKVCECVCMHCGKLLLDETNLAMSQAIKIRDPKKRFNAVWNLCKAKMICEADNVTSENDPNWKPDQPNKGGCGHTQPTVRRDGLKLWGTWKQNKNFDENEQPERRLLTPSEILSVFKHINSQDCYRLVLMKIMPGPNGC